jgi:hypothetical protein
MEHGGWLVVLKGADTRRISIEASFYENAKTKKKSIMCIVGQDCGQLKREKRPNLLWYILDSLSPQCAARLD